MLKHQNSKIKKLPALLKCLALDRKNKKRVVAISGSMDLLHEGHVFALTEAKKQGDKLVVLLNSDVSVKLYKGPNRPIISEDERAYMISSLACVDYVLLFDEINPKKILSKVRPEVYCVSSEWGKDCVEREVVESYGGKVHVIPRSDGSSTSNLINRLHSISNKKEVKGIFLDRDGTINHNKEGYIHTKEEFEFLPGVIQALKKLSRTDYVLFIITNQSGIGRGMYSEKELKKLNSWLVATLQSFGILITKIYYCPHSPDAKCLCRKPGYQLLLNAVKEYQVNLSKSWIIGDSWVDIAAGREANLRTIEIVKTQKTRDIQVKPHYVAQNLPEAVKIVLALNKEQS